MTREDEMPARYESYGVVDDRQVPMPDEVDEVLTVLEAASFRFGRGVGENHETLALEQELIRSARIKAINVIARIVDRGNKAFDAAIRTLRERDALHALLAPLLAQPWHERTENYATATEIVVCLFCGARVVLEEQEELPGMTRHIPGCAVLYLTETTV